MLVSSGVRSTVPGESVCRPLGQCWPRVNLLQFMCSSDSIHWWAGRYSHTTCFILESLLIIFSVLILYSCSYVSIISSATIWTWLLISSSEHSSSVSSLMSLTLWSLWIFPQHDIQLEYSSRRSLWPHQIWTDHQECDQWCCCQRFLASVSGVWILLLPGSLAEQHCKPERRRVETKKN